MISISKQIIGLIAWIFLCFAASAAGAIASIKTKAFYAQLVQPEWAPPGWVFGPVWSILFTLMAIAAWLVWRDGGFNKHRTALILFVLQLIPNVLWSWLFFAWNKGALAFADIILLWFLIIATIMCFWKVNRLSAALLLPYLLWVSFATALCYSTWQLNPGILG